MLGPAPRALQALLGLALAPGSCLLAKAAAVPGADLQAQAFVLGMRLLIRTLRTRRAEALQDALRLILCPLDTFRYYELSLLRRWLRRGPAPRRYLDISSPRLLPITLLDQGWAPQSVLLNPDRKDLGTTRRILDTLGLGSGVEFRDSTVEELPTEDAGYDAITCVSVIEHIEFEAPVLRRVRQLLNPGGSAYISLPCAAQGFEELIDFDEYGLGKPDQDGFVFGQRFYDDEMLAARIFGAMGQPSQSRVVGESTPGFFFKNREAKARGGYPCWKEPLLVKRGLRYFGSVQELPGVGVVVMEFHKADERWGDVHKGT